MRSNRDVVIASWKLIPISRYCDLSLESFSNFSWAAGQPFPLNKPSVLSLLPVPLMHRVVPRGVHRGPLLSTTRWRFRDVSFLTLHFVYPIFNTWLPITEQYLLAERGKTIFGERRTSETRLQTRACKLILIYPTKMFSITSHNKRPTLSMSLNL